MLYEVITKVKRLRSLEVTLLQSSSLVVASSSFLKERLESKYIDCIKSPVIVINNGVSDLLLRSEMTTESSPPSIDLKKRPLKLFYIGTIGEWIDFGAILMILQKFHFVQFYMIGPIDTEIPQHPRIVYVGVVKHEELVKYTVFADAFIMPFVITDLVQSIDPIKVYEYIHFMSYNFV